MVVAVGEVQIHLPESRSLKDKRQVLKSIKDRLRNRFNVSVAESDFVDLWQRSTLAVAVASSEFSHAEEVLSKAVDFIESDGRAHILEVSVESL